MSRCLSASRVLGGRMEGQEEEAQAVLAVTEAVLVVMEAVLVPTAPLILAV